MDIICNIVLIILAADLTGTIFALIWFAMLKYFDKYLRADIINFSLKVVIISFYIPSMVIILSIKSYLFSGFENYYAQYTDTMRIISVIVLIVLLFNLVKLLIKWIKKLMSFKSMIAFNAKADDEVQGVAAEIRKKLKIRRKIKVYVSIGALSPFIFGFFRPGIYIGLKKYDTEDLKIMLTHELNHYKQGDPYIKPMTNIMCCIHWFNPLARMIKKQYDIFSEAGCDYKCLKKAGFSSEDYFECLLKVNHDALGEMASFVSMSGTKVGIYERAVLAVKYTLRDFKKGILTLISVAAILSSSIVVYAATDITENAFNYIYINSSKQTEEEIVVCDDGFVEHIITNGKEDNIEYAQEYLELDCNKGKTRKDFFGEKINANQKFIYFMLTDVNDYGRVVVNVNVDNLPSDGENIKLKVGIVEPDGVIRYIEGDDIITHTFKISKSGDYKVYIENEGSEPVNIGGTATYSPREED